MTTGLYRLYFDTGDPDPISLEPPDPKVDSEGFRRGEPVDPAPELLRFPVKSPGTEVDVIVKGGYWVGVVARERVGALVGSLAPGDVQRIPARVGASEQRWELLHVLARIDCVDWEHTPATAYEADGSFRKGTLASLAPLIDRDKLDRHVIIRDMTLRTAGIEGPRIFRVVDWGLFPIVTAEIKEALEQEGVTGVAYHPVRTSP